MLHLVADLLLSDRLAPIRIPDVEGQPDTPSQDGEDRLEEARIVSTGNSCSSVIITASIIERLATAGSGPEPNSPGTRDNGPASVEGARKTAAATRDRLA